MAAQQPHTRAHITTGEVHILEKKIYALLENRSMHFRKKIKSNYCKAVRIYLNLGGIKRFASPALKFLTEIVQHFVNLFRSNFKNLGTDCVDSPQDYRGVYSSTSSGLPCVDWSSLNQSIHSVLPDRYVL